jgi:hypothetical protein
MINRGTIPFPELVDFLGRLGYAVDRSQSAEDHTTFRNPARSLRIILPAYSERAAVHPTHLAVVRHVLSENDEAEATEFQTWLEGRGYREPQSMPAR